MAQKEVLIKVKIEGQEVQLTSKQLELFKKNAENLRKELTALGDRSEKNAEQFDKLKGDLDKLDQILGQTKQEAKDTGDQMEEMGDKSEKTGGKVKSLKAQLSEARNALAALGPRTAENAEQFDMLTSKVQGLSEQYEDVQFGTKKLDDALSAIPGPIGDAAQAFKLFDDSLKNVKSALATLGRDLKDFKDNIKNFKLSDLKGSLDGLKPSWAGMQQGLLNVGKAIIASGVGAFVLVLGLLAAAVVKSLMAFKPLQEALSRFGVLFEVLQDAVKPLVEWIGNKLAAAVSFLAKAIAFATGNLDEYNKKLADKKATEQAAENLKKVERSFDANAHKYDEYTQRKMKADIEYNKKVAELREQYKNGEITTQEELNKLIKDYADKRTFEINQADKDRNKKAEETKNAANEKAKQIEDDFQKRLKTLRDENTLLAIKDENDKAKKQLELQKENQLKEIDGLKISASKKKQLIDETTKNYGLQLKALNQKLAEEQKKSDEDLAKQTRDIKTSMIEDEKTRMAEEAANRRDDALKAIDETKATEEAKAKAKLSIQEKYKHDLSKIDEEIAKKNKDNVYKQIEFERESRKLGLSNKLREIDLSYQSEVEKAKARGLVMQAQAEIDYKAEIDNLKKLLETKEITQTEFKQREENINRSYELTMAENVIKTQQDILDAREKNRQAVDMLGNSMGSLAQAMGEETAAGQALIKIQQGLALASTAMALADAFAGLGKDLKKGFPTNLIAVSSTLLLMGTAISQFKSLFGKSPKDLNKSGSGGGGESSPTADLGRGYATGGIIGGRRHAQGGTIIEAEQGEAIMTRGAVTMFKPMLSMMNQMGGGTSFTPNLTTTSYDKPVVDNPSENQSPMIIKTYVVSSEMTNEQEKQARLKDLSTL